MWNTSALLDDKSLGGRTLHALIGYSSRPSGIQLAAWLATLALLWLLTRVASRPKSRHFPAVAVLIIVTIATPAACADDPVTLVFRNHCFEPNHIEVPAHVKFKLLVKNAVDTVEKFESVALNREKLVTAGQTVTVFLGPLEPGEYKAFGDFH